MTVSNEFLTETLFHAMLLRDPSSEESAYWVNQLAQDLITPTGMILLAATAAEFTEVSHVIARMFEAAFNRYGTTAELMVWRQLYDTGLSLADMGEVFIGSQAFAQAHPGLSSTTDVLKAMAQAGLGRAATTAELNTLVPLVDDGSLGYGDILLRIVDANRSELSVGLGMLFAGVNGVAPLAAEISGLGSDIPVAVNTILDAGALLQEPVSDGLSFVEGNGLLTLAGTPTAALVIDLPQAQITIGGQPRGLDSGDLAVVTSVSAAALTGEQTVTFLGAAQAETYVASAQGDAVRGGSGNDQLTGGAGRDRYTLEATAATNGVDIIAGFQLGADGDLLDFSPFLNSVGTTTIATVDAEGTAEVAWGNGDVLVAVGYDLSTGAKVAELFGAGAAFAAPTARGKAVVITADVVGDATVWYLVNNTDIAVVNATELTKAATLTGVNNLGLLGFDASNFSDL